MQIIAKFFEVAAFSNLTLRVDAEGMASQENHRDPFAFAEQIRIDAEFNVRLLRATN